MSTFVAVSPSLRGDISTLSTLCERLAQDGFSPWVVPTSAGAQRRIDAAHLPNIPIGSNPGFGAAVTHGLNNVDHWDWALIINDDIELTTNALSPVLDDLPDPSENVLIYLDPVEPKAVPGTMSVLAQVSLVAALTKRVSRTGAPTPRYGTFRPFSIVLISRGLWDRVGGLDESMPYTFEDADFARRAAEINADVRYPTLDGIKHPASATSRRHVDAVLPVAAWSAMSYLAKWHLPRPVARFACSAALVVRLPMIIAAPLQRRSHLRGVITALRALATDREPALPAYSSL